MKSLAQKSKLRMPASACQRGYSLVELVFAVALTAGTLVPSLALIRDGLQLSETADRLSLLANYSVSTLEEQLAQVAATWSNGTETGDFTGDNFANIRFIAVRSDVPLSGGETNQLKQIEITTYFDDDGDDTLDADELQVSYRTRIGRFATYESIAGS